MTSTLDYGIAPPTFRLPAETHIGRVRLQVADLHRSIAFYERVVGLRVRSQTPASASLGPHGDESTLVELVEKRGVQPAPRHGRFGLYHFAVLLPGREALGRFIAHIVRAGIRFGAADHLVSEAIYLTDPDGLGIEVYSDRPRSAWQKRGSELAMATDPLDLGALVEVRGHEGWTGAPSGTVIGHVHLHVGNLGAGEAFYHAALGFDKMVWSYPGALFLSAGGYHHHLGTNTWSPGPAATDDEARLIDWELVLPSTEDVDAAASSITVAGFVSEPGQEGTTVADPWGTRVRLTSHDPRS